MTASVSMTVVHLAGAVALLFGLDAYLNREIRSLNMDADGVKRSIVAEVTRTRTAAAQADDAREQSAEALAADMVAAPAETSAAAHAAVLDVERDAESVARRMTQARRKQLDRAKAELAGLRSTAKATDEAASRLHAEVHSAASAAVASYKAAGDASEELGQTALGLTELRGNIDRDGPQLIALQRSSQRETFSFVLRKADRRASAGSLAIRLRRTDPRHQRCLLEVTASDGRTRGWDATAGAPMRFRTAGAPGWYELVVNQVAKDEVSGSVTVAGNGELARGYSSGRAETRYLPGR